MNCKSLDDYSSGRLQTLRKSVRLRSLSEYRRRAGATVEQDDTTLLSFGCNDYLGLSVHPSVVAASAAATLEFGAGAGASRLISGNHPLYTRLERQLADLQDTEDAVVFGSGYLANVGCIPALVGKRDLIFIDELAHSCMLAGAALARSTVVRFRHNDAANLAELLRRDRSKYRHCMILTEGVFSMDGDVAPLAELAAVAEHHDAWLYCDDAHGLGVLGQGRGASFAAGSRVSIPLQMGTLSKAVGGYGGYICASRSVCDLLRNRARSFVYSTGLPPGVIAAASAALEIIASDGALVERPLTLARRFTDRTGLPEAASAVVPLLVGASEAALRVSAALREHGFFVPAIRPPTVPNGTARLRFAFAAQHSERDVDRLADSVSRLDIA